MGGIDMAAVAASIAIQENPDSPEAKEAVNQLIASMAAYYDVARMISEMAVNSQDSNQIKVPEPRRNIHGTTQCPQYDQLTPAAQSLVDSMTADEFNKAYGQ
jgi:hypothetical protein